MGKIDIKKSTISLGVLFAIMHFVWGLIIALFGKLPVEIIHDVHFISLDYEILNFDIVVWILGTIEAAIIGAIIGAFFAIIWNSLK